MYLSTNETMPAKLLAKQLLTSNGVSRLLNSATYQQSLALTVGMIQDIDLLHVWNLIQHKKQSRAHSKG